MPKKISEIYEEYKIMPNLQEHMLRVAAVAVLICDNINESVDKESIITACLLHDMGNIIKSNFQFLPEFLEPQGLLYWQKIKDEYIKKYGINEEKATIQIMTELDLSNEIIFLADQNRFSLICQHCDDVNFAVKITHYSDLRVSPYGVVSYDERIAEGKKRYANHPDAPKEEEYQKLVMCGKKMEKQIFSKCKIKPEDINDETVALIILKLKNFVIK